MKKMIKLKSCPFCGKSDCVQMNQAESGYCKVICSALYNVYTGQDGGYCFGGVNLMLNGNLLGTYDTLQEVCNS